LAQEISPAGSHLLSGLGVSRLDTDGLMTFLSDESGNVIGLSDSSGAVQTQYSYGPSGAVAISGASSTNPYQFAGLQNNGLAMYYGSAEYYSPTLGSDIGGGGLDGGASADAQQSGDGSCDKCRALLRYRDVDDFWAKELGAEHTFWEVVQKGNSDFFSGLPHCVGSSDCTWTFPLLRHYAFLNMVHDYAKDTSAYPSSWDSGCSSDICDKVGDLEDFANFWIGHQNDQIPYDASGILYPNSNSAARLLGVAAGFSSPPPANAPPTPPWGAFGWYTPVP
jgi:hypothetical protein